MVFPIYFIAGMIRIGIKNRGPMQEFARLVGISAALAGLALPGATVFLPAAAADGGTKMPPVAARTNVTYAADIRPIFEEHCMVCHGETDQKRRLRLDSLKAVLKGCEDGPVIFPGKSDQGDLILEICGLGDHDMPPYPSPPPILSRERVPEAPASQRLKAPKPLTAEEISLVRAWVAQGAK